MRKILRKSFFDSRDTLFVARRLLGKFLIRKLGGRKYSFMITEVEAYDGPCDKASHAYRGKTHRNIPMFGESGRWYVYLTYGMHWMLNIVTGPKDYPAAILIRGVSQIEGPGRLTKRLSINKEFNNETACKKTGLWIEDRGIQLSSQSIQRSPRIGVAYAGEWARKPYRLYIKFISLSIKKHNLKKSAEDDSPRR